MSSKNSGKPDARPDVADVHAVIEPLCGRGFRTPRLTTRAAAAHVARAARLSAATAHTSTLSSSCYLSGGKMLLEKIRRGSVVAATITALALSSVASAFSPPPFPRVGGIQIGSPFNYNDPTYQASLARQDIMILADYPTMAPGGQSMNSAVQAIKAKNPNALVFVYVNSNQMRADQASGTAAWGPMRDKLNSMKWWLYSDSKLTASVGAGFGTPGDNAVNNTLFTPKDSSGNTAIDWLTKYFVTSYATTAPAVDGFFMDNVFWRPYIDGDWNRDGKIDKQTDPTVQSWLRQGYARYFALMKTLMPGKYQLGNIGDWGDPASTLTEYQGLVNGGTLEAYMGKSWSVETWAGWSAMMDRYRKTMANMAAPKLGIFNQWGSATDYQGMRYGLGSCLLSDGYYSFTDTSKGYYGVVWFDELDAKLGNGAAPPTAAWQKGVWRREFDNGIVLVNPKGNGPQTVTLGGSFVKIKGKQDPTTNNGQTVTTVTLKDRDGIILLRTAPVTRPAAPQKVTIEQ
jgi:hypothetical protein